MRLIPTGLLITVVLASPAAALPGQYAAMGFGGRGVADPDAGIERLAAASTRAPRGSGHDRPASRHHSVRDVLSSSAGPTRDAYAWLDNK
jgi:hypothetical protein